MNRELHIYPQEGPHDDAIILANREGLLALKGLIEDALTNPTQALFITGDGEGYHLFVSQTDSVSKFSTPYTEKMFRDHNKETRMNLNDLYHTLYSLEK